MNDITHKIFTLRNAHAQAVIQVSAQSTIDAILQKQVPKGDVFEFSRAAGLLAIKKTSDVIPDCHPLPIEYASIKHRVEDLQIYIDVNVSTIYKTGVEVEAMHGAAITALTMYDMLKPIDKNVIIHSIQLIEKSGGKNAFNDTLSKNINTAIVVSSDSVFAGKKEDKAGKAIENLLSKNDIQLLYTDVIADEKSAILQAVKNAQEKNIQLLIFTGGTGLSPRDITPETISPLLDREIPGIMEAARVYGQQRMPYAMLSRGVAGFIGSMLVLTLPGSTNGATETMQALFPYLKHVFKVAEGMRHE